jgi:hypothetical protein
VTVIVVRFGTLVGKVYDVKVAAAAMLRRVSRDSENKSCEHLQWCAKTAWLQSTAPLSVYMLNCTQAYSTFPHSKVVSHIMLAWKQLFFSLCLVSVAVAVLPPGCTEENKGKPGGCWGQVSFEPQLLVHPSYILTRD